MRGVWVLLVVSLVGCEAGSKRPDVVLPRVPPDATVASWSVVSRSDDRNSVHAVLEARRTLTTTTRSPDGTMMSTSRTISEQRYAALVERLRALRCCELSSTTAEQAEPAEAKPVLELELGDVQCTVELWDREWRAGRARECAFAFVEVHRAGFVPDPPVDDPTP